MLALSRTLLTSLALAACIATDAAAHERDWPRAVAPRTHFSFAYGAPAFYPRAYHYLPRPTYELYFGPAPGYYGPWVRPYSGHYRPHRRYYDLHHHGRWRYPGHSSFFFHYSR